MSRGLFPHSDLLRSLAEKVFGPHEGPTGGGPVEVGPGDSIGSIDLCWCGRPAGHDWPGREDKAPHPRYPD